MVARFFIIFIIYLISINASAEYYLVHSLSEALPACTPCPYQVHQTTKKYATKHKPHKNRYKIEVYYIYDPNTVHPCALSPPCCYEKMQSRIKSHDYVTFSSEPTSYYRTTAYPTPYDSYDQRTADDNAMRYPDVNNQY